MPLIIPMKETVPCSVRDYLVQDPVLRGQKYACVSFLSPRDAIASREAFSVSRFLGSFSTEVAGLFADIESRLDDKEKRIIANVRDRFHYVFDKEAMIKEYDAYVATYSGQILDDWSSKNGNAACVHGLKVRGSYETIEEAQKRAKDLKKKDPNFSVYVCEVGCWIPWAPNPDDIESAEYSETQLNTLMKEYNENMALRDEVYDKRKNELLEAAVEESAPGATETNFYTGESSTDASGVMKELVLS